MVQNKERRLARVSLVIPICVGTYAIHLGKKASDIASHQWTVYVRSPDNTDLSHVIKSVSFTLHTSFEVPVRTIKAMPYEVIEKGWGEFDILVKVEFADDAMEGPVTLKHRLKLYESDKDMGMAPSKKPVVRETHDEIVFWEPTEEFFTRVKSIHPTPAPPSAEPELERHLPKYSEQNDLAMLLNARNKIAEQRARHTSQFDDPIAY